ncbi:MAG: hypothetical protein JWQ97_4174 [Phenylobacterium sp.]|nr:hypothetical protein [Phenylobacterium sp.]
MNPALERLKLIFLAAFAVLTVAMMIWQFGWIWPRQNCEKDHKWWDNSQRVCAQPILISDITGRVIADPKARSEALKALGRVPNK